VTRVSPLHLIRAAWLIAVVVGGLWLSGLLGRAVLGSDPSEPPPPLSFTPKPSLAAPLPHAWTSPTASPPPSPTSSPVPSNTPSPTITPSATLSPTPTATWTPTITPTPIHKPSDSDPTRITIPAIGLDAPVVSVGIKEIVEGDHVRRVWEVADYAAGFHRGMARPGHAGNTVLSGHNNIRGEVFRDLYKLQTGDDIYLWVGDMPYHYQVSVKYRIPIKGAPPEVLQDNLRWIMPTEDQRLTLLTCWPNWSNTHRIIVIAFPVPWEA
jgi:sortase A